MKRLLSSIILFNVLIISAGSNVGKESKKSNNNNNNTKSIMSNNKVNAEVLYLDLLPENLNNKILLLSKINELKEINKKKSKFQIANDLLGKYWLEAKEYPNQRILILPRHVELLDFNFKINAKNKIIISFVRSRLDYINKFRHPDPLIQCLGQNSDRILSRIGEYKYSLNITSGNNNETIMINNVCVDKLRDFTTNANGTRIYSLENADLVIREKKNSKWIMNEPIPLKESYVKIGYLDYLKTVVLFNDSSVELIPLHTLEADRTF